MVSFLLAASLFYYVQTAVSEMRSLPDPTSEIVSQALFSESVAILEEQGDWAKIELSLDKYQGWVAKQTLCSREKEFLESASTVATVNRLAAHLYSQEDTIFGPLLTLPFESRLIVLEPLGDSKSRWIKVSLPDDRQGYIQRGDIEFSSKLLSNEEMCALSEKFLGLPYTWGGRSSFGYDCSGFMQMLYRQRGLWQALD